jgi:hypothetical protein
LRKVSAVIGSSLSSDAIGAGDADLAGLTDFDLADSAFGVGLAAVEHHAGHYGVAGIEFSHVAIAARFAFESDIFGWPAVYDAALLFDITFVIFDIEPGRPSI